MKLNTLTLADALRGSPSDTLYVVNRNPVVNTVDRTSRKPDIVFQVENTRLVIPGSMVGDVLASARWHRLTFFFYGRATVFGHALKLTPEGSE